jgi:hypothetical protein
MQEWGNVQNPVLSQKVKWFARGNENGVKGAANFEKEH